MKNVCDTCGGTALVVTETAGYPCPECHPEPALRQAGRDMRRVLLDISVRRALETKAVAG